MRNEPLLILILIVSVILLIFLSFKVGHPAEYLGEQPTRIGMVKLYLATTKEINEEVVKRAPRFSDMYISGFADRKAKEVWGDTMSNIYYHLDLVNDPAKWMEEQRRDEYLLRQNRLERWMKERQ